MFISLLGGVSVFGLLGLGPLVTAMVIGLFDAYTAPADIIGIARSYESPKQRNDARIVP